MVTLLLLVLSACGPSNSPEPTSSASQPIAVGTPSPSAEAEAVISAYKDFWNLYSEIGNPVNPADPRLVRVATGPQLKQVGSTLLAMKASGEIFKGETTVNPRVTEIKNNQATISDCSIDRSGIYDAESGALKEAPDERPQLATVTMVKIDGVWKVSNNKFEGYGCVPAE